MKLRHCISALILANLMFVGVANAQEIIQWRGNRTGIYAEKGLLKSWSEGQPQLLWHYDGLGEGHSSVAIADNKIYIAGMTGSTGYVYQLDLNGKLLNKKTYGQEWNTNYNGTRGTMTINDGKLYIISGVGDIVCMNASTLNVVWRKNMFTDFDGKNITWGVCESPLIVGEKLIATPGGAKNNIVALDKNTGKLIWTSPGGGDLSAYCSPLYVGDVEVPQVVTMTAKHIVGIDVSNGNTLWKYEQTNRWDVHPNIPIYGDGMLLCTSGYGRGSAMLRLTNGGRSVELAWFSKKLDSRIGAMVKLGSYAYGSGDNNKFWFCVDWKTGEIMYQDNSLGIGNVIADDGMLYCYSDRGELALVRATPDKFDITGRTKITLGTEQHWAHPVIYNGVLYLRHGDTLMAYKIK